MRSHLTRSVFRRLLSNEGYYSKCRARPALYSCRPASVPQTKLLQQRRAIFTFNGKAVQDEKNVDLAPGLKTMVDLSLMTKIRARPPHTEDIVKAFNKFFAHKFAAEEAVNSWEADHAVRTFKHLRDTVPPGGKMGISLDNLGTARSVMLKLPTDATEHHAEFARMMFAELTKARQSEISTDEASHVDLKFYVMVLALTGHSLEARDLVESFTKSVDPQLENRNMIKSKNNMWNAVLKGLAREDKETELLKSADMAENAGIPYSPVFHETMTIFYAYKNDISQTKLWYGRELSQKRKPSSVTLSNILRFSLRNNQLDWCTEAFCSILKTNPDKPTWDVIFQWAAGALGKGPEDIQQMMDVMVRRNENDPFKRPDVDTINGLVDLAISARDPYTAERYMALGLKSGIRPNAQTFILQMNYRLDAGDLSGAQAAYESLQGEEIVASEDIQVLNKYIRVLCGSKSPNYARIDAISGVLEERKARLEADTVTALCMMYLKRDDLRAVVDLLHSHSFHHTAEERSRTRDAFLSFCLDRSNSTMRIWDAYMIFQQIFNESSTEIRTRMMNEFFARRRPDMATHVFGHMRQDIQVDRRPTIDIYIQCFEGFARCPDPGNLDLIHNMMKMDSSIEPSTTLYNALMLAFSANEAPWRSMDFWTDITNSREGPNYNSLRIVFKVCQQKPFGDEEAKVIWNKMRRMEIDITPDIFAAYVGALAGHNLFEEAQGMIERMDKDLGYGPDALSLGTFYNALKAQEKKDVLEEWARDRYPKQWASLSELGQRTTEFEWRVFNLPDDFEA